jgi:hypothetical protein
MKWLRRLLGTDGTYDQIVALNNYISGLRGEIGQIRSQVSVTNLSLGRIIAKIDPAYATPEDDPKRKAASDAIGEEVIRKLLGEDHYSNRTRGY